MYENIVYERVGEDIGVLKIDQEKDLNVMNSDTILDLQRFINEQLPSEDIKVLVITSTFQPYPT